MPLPSSHIENHSLNCLIRDELDYDVAVETATFENLVRGLNIDQYNVYNAIIDAHMKHEEGLFFVYGSGGTGWNTLVSKFQSEKRVVISVALSGIDSLLLPGGKTAYSVFKLPLYPDKNSICSFDKDSNRAAPIREASLIIWDKAPMTHRLAFEAIDRHFIDICDKIKAFGGKLVVLGGDFRQILSIVTHGGRESIVAATLHRASFGDQCRLMYLRINMRLQGGNMSINNLQRLHEFAQWILQVGEGIAPGIAISSHGESNWIEIPREFLIDNDKNRLNNLIDAIYQDFETKYTDWSYLHEQGILAPTNNERGNARSYFSLDTLHEHGTFEDMEPAELLHSLNFSSLPNPYL